MITVTNTVKVYELDGREVGFTLGQRNILVQSHWDAGSMLILAVGGTEYTVKRADLIAAVTNACNSAK